MQANEGQKKASLFREKSLEAMDSPESLNDYLRVTSPRVWLVLAAVIVLLVGGIVWSIFGRIDTRRQAAVVTLNGKTACYVPITWLDASRIGNLKEVVVGGQTYAVKPAEDGSVTGGGLYEFIDENDEAGKKALERACRINGITELDLVWVYPLEGAFEDGVKSGTVTVDSLNPISLLLQ
ncbi:MAG: hypothetical protein IJK28_04650 [Clostridia bacterium]|nr:hypothetical protein [Clostridia bacterium]